MWLTRLFVRRPTLTAVLLAAMLLGGLAALRGLVVQQFPNVALPTVIVLANYPGASTSDMRDTVARPLEDSIAGAPDLDTLDTTIEQGTATIIARFRLGSDQNTDLIQVQRRVQTAQAQLPTDMRAPSIYTFDPSQAPVVELAVTSKTLATGTLAAVVQNEVVPALEQVAGVSNVEASGAVTPALVVRIRPGALAVSGATLNDVVNAIQANARPVAGGIAYGANRQATVDVLSGVSGPSSIANLLLPPGTSAPALPAGVNPFSVATRTLRIGDVAGVASGYEPRTTYSLVRGAPAIVLQVRKATEASEVAASAAVQAALPGLQRRYPQLTFAVINVQAAYTRQQLAGVERTLLFGVVLTGIVMLFFLRSWRNAVIALIAIPASFLVVLIVMRIVGFTLDTVSLLAMTLAVGILVDDSIVVIENADRHHAAGEEPAEAAVRGRGEIGLAAIVITSIDVAVFLPIAFLPGTVGVFLKEFGLVVVISTLTSLLVAFTVTPSLLGNWALFSRWRAPRIFDGFAHGVEAARQWYVRRALPWALRFPGAVAAIAVVSLVGALALLPLGIVGFEFVPSEDRGELTVQFTFPPGTTLAATREQLVRVEAAIDRSPDVRTDLTVAGGTETSFGGALEQSNVGSIEVYLSDRRAHPTSYWTSAFRALAQRLDPDAKIVAIPATGINGGVSQPIDELVSAGTGDPDAAAAKVAAALAATPGARDVLDSAAAALPQLDVVFDRARARVADVSIGTAAAAIRAAYGGIPAVQFTAPTGLEDVFVIYPQAARTIAALDAIPIRAGNGSIVHVGDVARITYAPAPPVITRTNRVTVVHVTADVAPGAELSNVEHAFAARLARLHLGPGVRVAPASNGTQANLRDTITGVGGALAFSFITVFLLLIALYNSYRSPLIILFSVPVAVVGALGSLALTHETLNLFSLIGTVLLIGLVSKNGVLLVDFANVRRASGAGKDAAMEEAAAIRFRPIVMTTFAMVAGMLPLAIGLEPGAQTRQALGTVVIGGLISSLLLTLLVVPIVYHWLGPSPRRSR